jgi:hypothetical protein
VQKRLAHQGNPPRDGEFLLRIRENKPSASVQYRRFGAKKGPEVAKWTVVRRFNAKSAQIGVKNLNQCLHIGFEKVKRTGVCNHFAPWGPLWVVGVGRVVWLVIERGLGLLGGESGQTSSRGVVGVSTLPAAALDQTNGHGQPTSD